MSDISIGDLVHLAGDEDMEHGLGLVLDKREDTAEMLKDFLQELGTPTDNQMKEAMDVANNYLLNNSVYLVHWQGGNTKGSVYRNIWMFSNEIELLSKVNENQEKI